MTYNMFGGTLEFALSIYLEVALPVRKVDAASEWVVWIWKLWNYLQVPEFGCKSVFLEFASIGIWM